MIKKNSKIKFRNFTPFLSFILCLSFSFFLMSTTYFYKLDCFAYEINNINNSSQLDNDFAPSMISIEKEEDNYFKPFKYFYYNMLNSYVRIVSTNNVLFNNDVSLQLTTQPTFYIKEKEMDEKAYYLDYGLFCTYFDGRNIFNGSYLSNRFGCDSFIFISDTFADILLDYYNLEPGDYLSLINEEKYAKLELTLNNETNISFSINNVLRSDMRSGTRFSTLYENFGTFWLNKKLMDLIDLRLEIELRDNPYGIRKTIIDIKSFDFEPSNSQIGIYNFSNEDNCFKYNEILSNKIMSLLSKKNVDLVQILIVLLIYGLYFLFLFLMYKKKNNNGLINSLLCLLCFLLYGLICQFIFTSYIFTILFLFYLALIFILYRKECYYEVFFSRKSIPFIKKRYLTISTIEI